MLVSITFDDGNEHQYNAFFPILEKYGLKGTFYVVTSWIGQEGFLNWDQLAKLYSYGSEIGSHTHTHQNLMNLSREALDFELYTSLMSLSHFDCKTLAYPYGGYNRLVIDYVKKYYIGARGYFVNNIRYPVLDEINQCYSLFGLATEESSASGTMPILDLPLHQFKKEIGRFTKGEADDWIIFVFHGQQVTFRWVLGNIQTIANRRRSLTVSQVKNSLGKIFGSENKLKKFRWLCEYLANNYNLETVTVSDGLKKRYCVSRAL